MKTILKKDIQYLQGEELLDDTKWSMTWGKVTVPMESASRWILKFISHPGSTRMGYFSCELVHEKNISSPSCFGVISRKCFLLFFARRIRISIVYPKTKTYSSDMSSSIGYIKKIFVKKIYLLNKSSNNTYIIIIIGIQQWSLKFLKRTPIETSFNYELWYS